MTRSTAPSLLFKVATTGLLLTCTLGAASAQTTGFIREKVLKNMALSCQDRQIDLLPAGTSEKTIEKYCECNAKYLADRLTNDEVLTLQSNTPPGPPEAVIKAANKSCAPMLK